MTVAEMLTALGRMLNDSTASPRFDDDLRLQALNAAQIRLIKFIPSDLLTELQAREEGVSIDETVGYDLSTLDSSPGPLLPGRYVNCYVSSLEKWCGYVWVDSMESRTQNFFLKGDDDNPIVHIFDKSLLLLATSAAGGGSWPHTADLYYIRRPKELVKVATGGYDTASCELDKSRHDQVVEAACAQIHRWEADIDLAIPFEQHVGTELMAELQIFQGEKQRANR